MRTIEVFADVGCPFAHASLRRLVQRRAELGRDGDVVIVVRSWPLELVNGVPLDPHHVAEEVAALQASVTPDLFSGFRADRYPATTLPALALAAAAYARDAATGEAVSLALRDLVFEQGVEIDHPSVLDHLADAHGLEMPADTTAVEADHVEGVRRGVTGSPHFFVDGTDTFCPVLDIAKVDGHFDIRMKDGAQAFLDRCLG